MGGYDRRFTEESIRDAWEACIEAGVVLFDTAEVYGDGESERIIGRLLARDPSVRDRGGHRDRSSCRARGSSMSPARSWPRPRASRRAPRGRVASTCTRSTVPSRCARTTHWPTRWRPRTARAWSRRSASRTTRPKETRAIDAALRTRGLRLATNQIEFSLLRAMPLRVGLLAACRELGVVPLAYSPIGQGRLTGKYSAANPPPGKRNFSAHPMEAGRRGGGGAAPGIGDGPRRIAPPARWRWPGSSPRAPCRSRGRRTAARRSRTPVPWAGR